MIEFFRHIRQQLLSESKFSKYLLYAIDEIILVVIGILIALQINTWSQNIKDSKEEHQILEKLKVNIQSDTLALKVNLSRIQSYLDTLKIIEREMQDATL